MEQILYHIHTEDKGRKKGCTYIIRTNIFNEAPRKCYRKRGKGYHEYENGILINL